MHYWRGLHVTKFGNLRENLPKVSGQIPRYSRFWETFRGDNFDLHWVVAVAVNFSLCSPILEQLEAVSTQRVAWALKFSDASRGGQKTFRLAMNWGSINHSFDSLRFCALPTPEIVAAFEAWHNKKPRGYRKALRELARAQRTYTLLEMEVANTPGTTIAGMRAKIRCARAWQREEIESISGGCAEVSLAENKEREKRQRPKDHRRVQPHIGRSATDMSHVVCNRHRGYRDEGND